MDLCIQLAWKDVFQAGGGAYNIVGFSKLLLHLQDIQSDGVGFCRLAYSFAGFGIQTDEFRFTLYNV